MSGEEEILEVQKNYSEEIIQEIQNAFNTAVDAKVLSNVEELPKTIFIDHVKLSFTYDGNRYDTCMYLDSYVDKTFMRKWRTEPIYAFLCKDWKKLNKGEDIFGNNNYIEAKFTVKGNIDIVALLRRIDIDLAGDSFELMEYDDIHYNDMLYTIIKAYSPTIQESYDRTSKLENVTVLNKFYDNYGNELQVDENGNINGGGEDTFDSMSIDELPDPESEELF